MTTPLLSRVGLPEGHSQHRCRSGEPTVVSVLSNFVSSVADTLRRPYAEDEYGSVILPFTVLRRLECVRALYRETVAEIVQQYPGGAAATYTPEDQDRTY